MKPEIFGVYCAAATPMNADLSPDLGRFAEHCRRLIADGCHGVALLGTTGEANSFTVAERKAILEAALEAGLSGDQLMPGTGLPAIGDTVDLTRHALDNGVDHVIMLPPFYYKGMSDEGLFAAYARTIDAVGSDRLKVVLYNFPQMSGIALSLALIGRLLERFPGTVVGMKDSSGDIENMKAAAAAYPQFSVFAGADPLLLPLLRVGGAGSITATSNLVANSLRTIFDNVGKPDQAHLLEAAQARINAFRSLSNSYAQIPTIKAMVGVKYGDDNWNRVRPPMLPLDAGQLEAIKVEYGLIASVKGAKT